MADRDYKNAVIGVGGIAVKIINNLIDINSNLADFIAIDKTEDLIYSKANIKFNLVEYKDKLEDHLRKFNHVTVIANRGDSTIETRIIGILEQKLNELSVSSCFDLIWPLETNFILPSTGKLVDIGLAEGYKRVMFLTVNPRELSSNHIYKDILITDKPKETNEIIDIYMKIKGWV